MPKPKTPIYKLIEFIKEVYPEGLDALEDYIRENFPEDWKEYEDDNYDGPRDPYSGAINY